MSRFLNRVVFGGGQLPTGVVSAPPPPPPPPPSVTFAGSPPNAVPGQSYDWMATVVPAGSAITLDAATSATLAARNIAHDGFGRFTSTSVS